MKRALCVINVMVENPGANWGVRELARACQWPASTVHGVLQALEEQGLVRMNAGDGRYRLGLEFFRIAWRATAGAPMRSIALPLMTELVTQCDETAYLGVYDQSRSEMMIAATAESRQPLRYVLEQGRWFPVHAGAAGLAVLAFLPPEERQEIVVRVGLKPVTKNTITVPVELERELGQIRRQGYALARGQRIPGSVGIAAPIWGPEGRVVASLGLTVPEQRFDTSREGELAPLVVQFAQRIAEQQGGSVVGFSSPSAVTDEVRPDGAQRRSEIG